MKESKEFLKHEVEVFGDNLTEVIKEREKLKKYLLELSEAITNGFSYDPGHSDLYNEQPIHVRMTLGDYRRASDLKYRLKNEYKI